jgi:8-oxo-dGTP diphosphatase
VDVGWRRAAAYVVCRDDLGRLLLTRFVSPAHPDSGRWTMPGGGMEWGESPEATAVRELEEETGFKASVGPVLGVFSQWITERESVRSGSGHHLGIVYEGSDLVGQIRTSFDEGTTDAARWFTIGEVHDLPRVELVDFVLSLI